MLACCLETLVSEKTLYFKLNRVNRWCIFMHDWLKKREKIVADKQEKVEMEI